MNERIPSIAIPEPALALRRARSAIYVDGLWEIAYGLIWLLLALFLLLGPGYTSTTSFSVVVTALVMGLGFAGRRIVNWIKEHWVYPRTGYVALRQEPLSRRSLIPAVAILVTVIAGMVLLVAVFERGWLPVLWFPIAIMLTQVWIVLLPIAIYHHDWRFYGLVLLSSSVSVLLYLWGQAVWGASGMAPGFFAGLSGGLIFSGVIKLWAYLWHHPIGEVVSHGE